MTSQRTAHGRFRRALVGSAVGTRRNPTIALASGPQYPLIMRAYALAELGDLAAPFVGRRPRRNAADGASHHLPD
jgi:hypothetical protein